MAPCLGAWADQQVQRLARQACNAKSAGQGTVIGVYDTVCGNHVCVQLDNPVVACADQGVQRLACLAGNTPPAALGPVRGGMRQGSTTAVCGASESDSHF